VVLAVVIFVSWNLIRALRGFFTLLLISTFLAVAMEPAVAYLGKRGWRRGLATGVIFVVAGLASLAFVGLMIPVVVSQVVDLVDRLPSYVQNLSDFLARFGIDLSVERIREALTSIDSSLQSIAGDVAGSVFGVGSRLVTTLLQLLTVGLFTFYLTADGPRLRRTLLSVVSPRRQREILRVIEIAIDKTGAYFYSRTLLAGVATLVTWIALRVIGVPFALPLSLWVGVMSQFIPVIGTYIGGALPVLIALLGTAPAQAVWVIGYILVYQQVENYLIAPRITARTMALHPAVAFGSAIVGGTLMGAAGAVMALPVAATVQAFVSTYLDRHQLVDSELLATHEEAQPRRKQRQPD
jgi:predicted PurR-regulated permease PerM